MSDTAEENYSSFQKPPGAVGLPDRPYYYLVQEMEQGAVPLEMTVFNALCNVLKVDRNSLSERQVFLGLEAIYNGLVIAEREAHEAVPVYQHIPPN